MKLLRMLGYFVGEGCLAMVRHKALHGFAIFVVALSLFVLGFSRYLTGNVNLLISTWSNNLEVRVFLEDGLPRDRVEVLRTLFGKNPMVAKVKVVSPEMAMRTLARIAPAFGSASKLMAHNPLPTSLALRLRPPPNLEKVHRLVAMAKKEKGVSQVIFDWEWVNKLKAYSKFVSFVGWLLFAALGAAALFTVAAITRILALSRREEIGILNFVGATTAGIRGPFVAGGAIMGLLSGFIALAGLFITHLALQHAAGANALLLKWISGAFLPGTDQLLLLATGLLLGAVGGAVSIGSSEHWG